MLRSATSVWSTGRGGSGACKGRRSLADVSLYRPAKTLADAVGGVGSKLPISDKKVKHYVAVASELQAVKQWTLAIITATWVVERRIAVADNMH